MIVEERDALILDLDWHPTGKYIAVSGSDGIVRVWEKGEEDFKQVALVKRERSVRRVQWSPDGERLAIACFDSNGLVYKFDYNDKSVLTLEGKLEGQENELKTIRWSSDGKYLLTCSRDKMVYVWSLEDFDVIAIHNEHTADVKDATFSKDGNLMVSVSFDGTTKLWSPLEELGSLKTFSDHKGTVWSVAFNPNNEEFVTIGEDGKAILYSTADEKYEKQNEIELQTDLDPLYSVVFSKEENLWIIAGADRKIFYLDESLTDIVKTIDTPHLGDVNCAKPNPVNLKQIATGSDDGKVCIINLE